MTHHDSCILVVYLQTDSPWWHRWQMDEKSVAVEPDFVVVLARTALVSVALVVADMPDTVPGIARLFYLES